MRRAIYGVGTVALLFSGQGAVLSAAAQEQSTEELRVDTVTVTARKRDESAQDVPIAITAFSEDRLRDEDIDSLKELIQLTPSAMVADLGASFSNEIILRGQGGGRNINSETATGIYRNGIFVAGGNIGGRNFNRMDMFDVQRIEVLRGPQGALYGRNAVGGAINLITKRPGDEFEGQLKATYGTNELTDYQAIVNLPLTENFAVRAGAKLLDQNSGFFTDAITGEAVDTQSFTGGRIAARYHTETIEAVLTYDKFDEEGPSFGVGTFNPTIVSDPYAANSFNFPTRFERDEATATFELGIDTQNFRIDAVTLHKSRDATTSDDVDAFLNLGNGLLGLTRTSQDEFTRLGQEVRVSSQGNTSFDWLVGAEISEANDEFAVNSNNARISVSDAEDLSWAFFGSVSFDLAEKLRIDLEGRYSQDDKQAVLTSRLSPVAPVRVQNFQKTFDNFSPKVTATYALTPRHRIYISGGTAYRAGGFNPEPDDAPTPRFEIPYDEENIKGFEVGFKSEPWSNTLLNFAAFQSETSDAQTLLQIVPVSGGASLNYLLNAGTATQQGLEFDGISQFSFGEGQTTLRFDYGGAWADSEVESADPSLDGTNLSYVRDWQASLSTTVRHQLGFWGSTLFLNHSFRGGYGGWQNEAANRKLDDIVIHDLRAGFETPSWSVVLSSENLLDKFYIPQRNSPTVVRASDGQIWKLTAQVSF